MEFAVGIDLGTTNSVVARLDDHERPVVVPNGDGATTTPSVVCFQDGETLVGAEAKEMHSIGQWPVAAFFKRQMGDPHFVFHAEGVDHTATDLSAIVLRKLKSDAEAAVGVGIRHAVITVPAYFRHVEREATIEAGRAAGLDVLQIINEPTAAAIAYGAGRAHGDGGPLLVYDLGGGTFDVTLLELAYGEIRVRCSDGDKRLGGKDWDDRIIDFLGNRFRDDFGVDPLEDAESLADLRDQAEKAKKRLSAAEATTVSIVHDGCRECYRLTRERFEELTGDLLERTVSLTNRVVEDATLRPEEVNGVLFVGGSTRMPAVRHRIERAFGRPPRGDINEDEAVALGAAIVAAWRLAASNTDSSSFMLAGALKTLDVTNHSLGMIAVNADRSAYVNSIILPKNAEIPCEETRPYQQRTRPGGGNRVEVFMTQGETDRPDEVAYLGKYVVKDVPHLPSGVAIVDVTYCYDRNGTVEVSASARGSAEGLDVAVEDLPDDIPGRFLESPDSHVQEPEHLTAYLAFDLSGSMSGEPLREAKKAARGFLRNIDLGHCSLGVIAFSNCVQMMTEAIQNARTIERAIERLEVGETGWTNDAHPFDEIRRRLKGVPGRRFAIVLADGVWSCQERAIRAAKACHGDCIQVVAIGFGGADLDFLRAIASSEEASFFTGVSRLVETFSSIAQVLTETGGEPGSAGDADGSGQRLGFLSALRRGVSTDA